MKNLTPILGFAIILLGLVLSAAANPGEKDLDSLVSKLGTAERARGGLGEFYVMSSEVTREVISNGPEIVPELLDLSRESEDLRQLASVVSCLREMEYWSAVDAIRKVDERIDEIREAAEANDTVLNSDSPGIRTTLSSMNLAILSNEIRMFFRDSEQARSDKSGN